MTRLLPPLEGADDCGQVRLELARPLEGAEDHLIVGAAVADPLDAPPLDLARDEPAEGLANALGLREEPEVPPDVVGDLDARLAIADRRRPLLMGIGAGSPAASSSHGTSVARASLDPSPYSRMRGINDAIVCLSWRSKVPARLGLSASRLGGGYLTCSST
ncbi:MAG: hypothetical protein JWL77_6959 [Chthonomonadaceae bacterium]|nr:hypothetical protein [Chthonomonadaceae bacterium]